MIHSSKNPEAFKDTGKFVVFPAAIITSENIAGYIRQAANLLDGFPAQHIRVRRKRFDAYLPKFTYYSPVYGMDGSQLDGSEGRLVAPEPRVINLKPL